MYDVVSVTVVSNLTGRPDAVAVDSSGNIYVSDTSIQVRRFDANGSVTSVGVVIAPITNQSLFMSGNSLSQIGRICALQLNRRGDYIYLSDTSGMWFSNQRIQKWSLSPGTVAGETVAGAGVGSVNGSYNAILVSYGLFLDSSDQLYVSSYYNHYVTRWPPNEIAGILVAGTGSSGSNLSSLFQPTGIWVDSSDAVYVVDSGNHRVMKWLVNATSGIVIAGGQGRGSFAVQLDTPTAIIMDGYGNMFIMDSGNRRIQQFVPGSLVGITVFDGSFDEMMPAGIYSMAMDSSGHIYVPDSNGQRILKIVQRSGSQCNGMFLMKSNFFFMQSVRCKNFRYHDDDSSYND